MQALIAALAQRGTFVTPEAAATLEKAPHLQEGLLSRIDLPLFLTPEHLAHVPPPAPRPAPPTASAPELVVPPPRPAPPQGQGQAPVVAPFTPDTRGATEPAGEARTTRSSSSVLVEPEPPAPAKFKRSGKPLAARPHLLDLYPHKIDILADVTGNSTCEGEISDFTKYFNDRLNKIRKMIKQRRPMAAAVPIGKAKMGGLAKVPIIGIVTEVRTTKNGHRLIEIEDETGSVAVLAPQSEHQVLELADTIIEDEVIGLVCKPPGRGDLLILEEIVRPDVPMQNGGNRSPNSAAVAVLSDIHFGSKTFLSEDWERFIKWINLDWGDSRMKALARKVKYVIVNGDVVDGIGIFPGQEEELAIVDAYDQYAYAGEQLNRIRDDIKMYVLPGNHDLVRPAEPQPALPEKYKSLFPESVTHVGNPCKFSIEGVEFLSYHGRSMDDWITRVAGLTYDDPIAAMKEMMQRRHVLPVYGLRTPIAPEHKDYLVIESVPDVFITGHVHAAGLDNYRGTTLINASCWQSQTAYQKMHGFMPDPSKVPVVELDTGKPWMVDFHRGPTGVDRVGRSEFGGAFRQPARIDDPSMIT